MKCICHSFNLCASYACKKLPQGIEDLPRGTRNYITNSPKETFTFAQFQTFTVTPIHRILHPAQTRWLSLESLVNRFLEQFDALILYFIDAKSRDRLRAAEAILQKLQDPLTKMFLQFLKFVLPLLNNLNRQMQCLLLQLYSLHKRVASIYKIILECFIKRDVILNMQLQLIDFKNPRNYLPMEKIYVGAENAATLATQNITKEQKHFFLESVKVFGH